MTSHVELLKAVGSCVSCPGKPFSHKERRGECVFNELISHDFGKVYADLRMQEENSLKSLNSKCKNCCKKNF